jgi:uncharacterized membrane protein YqaE (UPF0057 family)
MGNVSQARDLASFLSPVSGGVPEEGRGRREPDCNETQLDEIEAYAMCKKIKITIVLDMGCGYPLFPPVAVADKHRKYIILVLLFTIWGWIPGVIMYSHSRGEKRALLESNPLHFFLQLVHAAV